jgi:hypothetical protein
MIAAVNPLQKSIFDLRVNSVQPLLGSIGPISVCVDFSFQFCDPLFGRAQLLRKLLSHFQRVSAVIFGNAAALWSNCRIVCPALSSWSALSETLFAFGSNRITESAS